MSKANTAGKLPRAQNALVFSAEPCLMLEELDEGESQEDDQEQIKDELNKEPS